ncbi:hypothetical protein M2321_004113 [Rhodoblastus acidophilus]|uniref:hypothetical protein n=1 Tax=Rhodoblastus acidophilus TaxID=1074 RepID=UPI001FEEFAB4|nr:hypothetical protein [Rhodoblastus acidophilus]MCW2276505.1 hypothetical protein [Rhodoblastus acidophilus]
MCDIARERQRIDALIAEAITPFRFMDSAGDAFLVDLACAALDAQFLDFVAPAAIRARCEKVIARLRGARGADPAFAVAPAE